MHQKEEFCVHGFIVQSNKFVKATFISTNDKKQGMEIAYTDFVDFFKNHFLKDGRLSFCSKIVLNLNSFHKIIVFFLKKQRKTTSILKGLIGFVQKRKITFIAHHLQGR